MSIYFLISTIPKGSNLPNTVKKIEQNAKPKRRFDLWGVLDPVPKQQEKIILVVLIYFLFWGRI